MKNEKLMSVFLIMVLLATSINLIPIAYAENDKWGEISINDEFSEDRIIVIMENDASLKFKSYNANDFADIDCEEVVDISENAGNKVCKAMENIKLHVTQGETLEDYDGVALGDYKQILCIKLKNPGKENVIEAISKLDCMDEVYVACPDYKIKAYANTFNPNDDNTMDWGIKDDIDYLELISLYDAWNITTGSKSVKVAIMDSGIDTNHEDLSMNFETTNYSGVFDDGNYTDGPTKDNYGHGTQVAGIICANGNNNKGIAGVCWNIEFVSLRILEDDGQGYSYHALQAFNHLVGSDVDIVNMSCGWYPVSTNGTINPRYQESFQTGIGNFGKLVVCASGNNGQNLDTFASFPTAYNCANVITVGASDENDNIWEEGNYSSNTGKNSIDLFAPGYRILSTYPTEICEDNEAVHSYTIHVYDGYHVDSGTSFAAPFVTGVAALMLSINPNLTAIQLKDIIVRSVDIVPALQNHCISGGRLNAYKAVRTAQMYRFAANTTYTQLASTDTLYTTSHGVLYDFCSECTCRTPDYSCDNCDMCDPCEDCHIYYTELHYWQYSSNSSLTYHIKYCRDCGYVSNEAHNWVETVSMYICTVCGKTSTAIPEIAVYLPPDNDEENLTE
jgi:subtilisin family serine protease